MPLLSHTNWVLDVRFSLALVKYAVVVDVTVTAQVTRLEPKFPDVARGLVSLDRVPSSTLGGTELSDCKVKPLGPV